MTRRSQGSKTVSTSRAHPLRSSGAPVLRRGRLLVLLSLLALALGLWARAPLRELWLARQPLGDLAAYTADHTSDTEDALLLAWRFLEMTGEATAVGVLRLLTQT